MALHQERTGGLLAGACRFVDGKHGQAALFTPRERGERQ